MSTFIGDMKGHIQRNESPLTSCYFWDNLQKNIDKISVHTGIIHLNRDCDRSYVIKQVMHDIAMKCDIDRIILELFHDQYLGKTIIHYLLVFHNDQLNKIKQTIIFGLSEHHRIDVLSNKKNVVNHYLGSINHFPYLQVEHYSLENPQFRKSNAAAA